MRSESPFVFRPPLLVASGLALSMAACGDGSSGDDDLDRRVDDQPLRERDGVLVDGSAYPLAAAIGEVWGDRSDWPGHFNVRLTLTDGRFAITPIVIDGRTESVRRPVEASAVLRADLYAPGTTAFPFTVYGHVADPSAEAASAPSAVDAAHFFTRARLGVDTDRSGEVDDAEMREVVGGTIEFVGPVGELSLTFELVFEDGVSASGSYAGLFEFVLIP